MNTDDIILISDPVVLKIPIQENHAPLVNLQNATKILVDTHNKHGSKIRKSVALKLLEAAKTLPNGLSFLVTEVYRPLSLQKKYFESYSHKLQNLYPSWDARKVYEEASKFVAPPEIVPPHSTGGAIDLTLINESGQELDMGTALNANPEKSKNACFTDASNISNEAKANRKMLIEAMTKSGFANYPTEWWHWSWGDRYWAYQTNQSFAVFGSID